jgi:hypothetical protein
MGVKLKLVIAAFLVLSVSVLGQDLGDVQTERTFDEDVQVFASEPEPVVPEENVEQSEPQPESKPEGEENEPAVEVISETQQLEVRNDKYQVLNDVLDGQEPAELEAVNIDPNGVLSERQLLFPPDSTATSNGYGKYHDYNETFNYDYDKTL